MRLERRELQIIAAGLVLVLLSTLLVYRRVARPITRLGAAVRSTAGRTPPEAVPVFGGPAELTALAEDVNGLIAAVRRELLERRQAELQLRRLAAIVESSNDAIIGMTLDRTITSWNAAAERIYGYRAEDAIGQSISLVVPPDRKEELPRVLARLREGGAVENFETKRVRKDGRAIDVSLTISPIRNGDGSMVGASTIAHDITSRRLAEAALRESEARTRAMLESALDAVVTIDHKGAILEFNPAAEQVFGHSRSDVVGKQMADLLIPPHLREAHYRGLERFLETGEGPVLGRRVELTALRADGSEFPVELAITQVALDGPPMFTAYLRDISERVRAEEALRRSEESYRLLFERHPGPMWLFDPETLRFLAVNESAVASYGYSRAEFLLMTIEEIRPAEDRKLLREALRDRGRRLVDSGVWRHRKNDGTVIDAAVSSSAIQFEGRPARLVLAQDVTERRRLEEQLRQSQKMEAVGNLAGGIAHDFNNILMVIRTVGAMLLKGARDEETREGVLQIDAAAVQATELIHQLLAFSRMQVLQPKVTDLNEVVEETLTLLGRVIGEDIEIAYDLEPDLRSTVVDRTQMGQVILNLAVNARDAMPGGGSLTIGTANVDLDEAYSFEHVGVAPGSYAVIQVTDTGEGMDQETREHVFEPFFTTKDEGGGTGLGLATVYGIVKQSGGHIWLYSEPGLGTTFKLYFPSATAGPEPQREPVAVAALDGHETILLVEDDDAVRPLVAGSLRSYGYTVLEASGGAEALEIAAGGPSIDLLLTDVVMPEMNGGELAEQLVRDHPALRVLFTSGYPADTAVRRGIAESGAAFIQKPYLPDDLARMVRQVLGAC